MTPAQERAVEIAAFEARLARCETTGDRPMASALRTLIRRLRRAPGVSAADLAAAIAAEHRLRAEAGL